MHSRLLSAGDGFAACHVVADEDQILSLSGTLHSRFILLLVVRFTSGQRRLLLC